MAQEKVLKLEQLERYHGKNVALMDEKDAKILADAKLYADGLGDNYDPAGTATTKVQELADGQVKTNTEAIAKLNGDSTVDGSVDKKVADAINTFATQISDDGTINTYKEVLNYLATHQGDATEMAAAIDALETLVGDKSVATQIAEAITAENLDQYATDDELADAIARIVVLEGKVTAIENDYLKSSDKTELNAAIADAKKAGTDAQTEIDNLEEYVGTIPEDYTEKTVIAYINKKAEETLNAASGGSSESAASVLAALNTYKAENDAKVTANTEAIDAIEEDYLKNADKTELTTAIAEAKKAGTDAQTDVDALETTVSGVSDKANANETAISTLNETTSTHAEKITALEEKVGEGWVAITDAEIDALFE